MPTKKFKVQVIQTREKFYDRKGGEMSLAALARCCEGDIARVEEQSMVVFEAAGDTVNEIEMAVWAWCAAIGAEIGDLELAFPLSDDVRYRASAQEAALEAHLDALNDPDLGWRLPR